MIRNIPTAMALAVALAVTLPALAQAPLGVAPLASFRQPWAVAALPQGGFLVTEKAGRVLHLHPSGDLREIGGVPAVLAAGQTGLHDVAVAPDFDRSGLVYLTWVAGIDGGALHLGRGRLDLTAAAPRLDDFEVLWRAEPEGGAGHPGAVIAFSPDGFLFLTSGERQLGDPAQVLSDSRGKILRLTLDGRPAPGNPFPDAPEVWSLGHRNPYGLAFDAAGQLWSHEMGPRGGDELNLIGAGRNYGWPAVSEGRKYSGLPIPGHASRPDLTPPLIAWSPVIAPAGMIFYQGAVFPDWQGSLLIGGLRSQALVQVTLAGGQPREAGRWSFENRIRDVVSDAEGNVYLLEDGDEGRLVRIVGP